VRVPRMPWRDRGLSDRFPIVVCMTSLMARLPWAVNCDFNYGEPLR
jgi:hypothetical protein